MTASARHDICMTILDRRQRASGGGKINKHLSNS